LEQRRREEEELRLAEEAKRLEHERYLSAVAEQERKRKEEEERQEMERREVGSVTCRLLLSLIASAVIVCFSSTGSDFDLAWFSSLSSEPLCIFGLHSAVYIKKFCYILYFTLVN